MKTYKIPFAFDSEGNIYDYKTGIKGKDYICQCGDIVRIRGGEKVSNHFYHINETECSNESIIHKAYKTIFEQVKQIKLPVVFNGSDILKFDKVELEKRINDFQPDAIGYIAEEMYLIEFAKTSFITDRKLNKIKKTNLFCLEIAIDTNLLTLEEIKKHISTTSYNKEIVHSPTFRELEEFKKKARTEFLKQRIEHNAEIKKLESKIEELENELDLYRYYENCSPIYLNYIKKCKNDSIFFRHKTKDIVAFANDNGLTLKIGSNSPYKTLKSE